MSSHPTSMSTPRASRRSLLRSRRGRTGLAGCAVLLAALPLLAACAAGSDPEVYQIVPDNGQATAGDMYMANVWVVYDQNSGNAEVIGQVANTNPSSATSEQLTGVTLGGAAATLVPPADTTHLAYGVTISGNTVTIPGLKAVQFGQPGQPELEVPGADVTLGTTAQVTFTFGNGQSANVAAIVEPDSGQWAQYNPNGPNTASPSAQISGTATTSATPTGTATGTVTGTATASPSGTATGLTAKSTATPSSSATH